MVGRQVDRAHCTRCLGMRATRPALPYQHWRQAWQAAVRQDACLVAQVSVVLHNAQHLRRLQPRLLQPVHHVDLLAQRVQALSHCRQADGKAPSIGWGLSACSALCIHAMRLLQALQCLAALVACLPSWMRSNSSLMGKKPLPPLDRWYSFTATRVPGGMAWLPWLPTGAQVTMHTSASPPACCSSMWQRMLCRTSSGSSTLNFPCSGHSGQQTTTGAAAASPWALQAWVEADAAVNRRAGGGGAAADRQRAPLICWSQTWFTRCCRVLALLFRLAMRVQASGDGLAGCEPSIGP